MAILPWMFLFLLFSCVEQESYSVETAQWRKSILEQALTTSAAATGTHVSLLTLFPEHSGYFSHSLEGEAHALLLGMRCTEAHFSLRRSAGHLPILYRHKSVLFFPYLREIMDLVRDPSWFPVKQRNEGSDFWSQTTWVQIPAGLLGQVTSPVGLSFLIYKIVMIDFPLLLGNYLS